MEDVDMHYADIYSEFRLKVMDGKERFLCLLEPCVRLNRSYAGKQSWIEHRLRIHRIENTGNIPDIRVIRRWFDAIHSESNDTPAISGVTTDVSKSQLAPAVYQSHLLNSLNILQPKIQLAPSIQNSKFLSHLITLQQPSASLHEELPKQVVSGSALAPADRSDLTQQPTNQTLGAVHNSVLCKSVVRTIADLLIKGLCADYLNLAVGEDGRQRTLPRETTADSEVPSITPAVESEGGVQHALSPVRDQHTGKKSISRVGPLKEKKASSPASAGEDNCDCTTCVRDLGKLYIK